MMPLGLAALLFVLFTLFGKAYLELVRFRSPVLRNWLIAPTVGFVLIEILVCFFNQFCNLPVKAFAGWMLLALLLGAATVLWWRRPVFPGRHLAPFGGVLAFSLLYTGWPALIHGFNWMSFVNGDMTYFSAGAVRLLDHPFYAMPSLQDLVGWDYTQYTWDLHVVSQVRSGSEMLLAWSSGAMRWNPVQIYMPLLLALQLAQLCAAGALVLTHPNLRRPALLTVVILSLSPLFSFGTLSQLLPQSGGISVMLVLTVLLTTGPRNLRRAWSYCLLLATVVSGIFLHYPEVIAFGVLSAGVFHATRLVRGGRFSWLWAGCVAASGLLVCIMIREALLTGIVNTLGNVQTAALTGVTAGNSIFPQYMLPSGMANLLGLVPIGRYPAEPILSGAVLIGLVLLIVAFLQTTADVWSGCLYASMLGVMFTVGLIFFWGANDYGLFKLAMFCQAPLAACFSSMALRRLRRWWRLAPVLVVACTVSAQTYYTAVSSGLISGGMVEVPGASRFGLTFAVPKITAISDIYFRPAQGLGAIVFRGSEVLYPSCPGPWRGPPTPSRFRTRAESSGPHATTAGSGVIDEPAPWPTAWLKERQRGSRIVAAEEQSGRGGIQQVALPINSKPPGESRTPMRVVFHQQAAPPARLSIRDRIADIVSAVRKAATFPVRKFVMAEARQHAERDRRMNRPDELWGSEFYQYPPGVFAEHGEPEYLLTLRKAYLLNATSRLKRFADYGMFRLVPYRDVQNWLVYVPSTRGPDFYFQRYGAAFYQPGPDPYSPEGFTSAVGSFVLFEVLHPTKRLRVRMSLTRSVLGAHQVLLPPGATVEGESTAHLPFVGDGAAVVYSEPVSPLWKDGHAYLAIDFGQEPAAFPNDKTGLMRLYNREWALDQRRLVGFARDISAISEEEYIRVVRPRMIASFPGGLLGAEAPEYSGFYEDGWLSDESYVRFGGSDAGNKLTVRGMVPALGTLANGRLKVAIRINDEPSHEEALKPGDFRLDIPIHQTSAITTMNIRFSDRTALPGLDGRMVSALIRSMRIE